MVTTPTVVLPSSRPLIEESGVCGVCPHPLDSHDRISLRFCHATQATAATRGCVCPSS
jgi:hypothetical protein